MRLGWVAVLALGCLACGVVTPPGHDAHIRGEDAVIVWNPANRVEHFIRRASFDGDAADFGFLVPTPTRPELGEVSDRLFDDLVALTQPRRPWIRFKEMTGGCSHDGVGPVVLLEARRVAGYDAAVLRADRAEALAGWLKAHGYASRPVSSRQRPAIWARRTSPA